MPKITFEHALDDLEEALAGLEEYWQKVPPNYDTGLIIEILNRRLNTEHRSEAKDTIQGMKAWLDTIEKEKTMPYNTLLRTKAWLETIDCIAQAAAIDDTDQVHVDKSIFTELHAHVSQDTLKNMIKQLAEAFDNDFAEVGELAERKKINKLSLRNLADEESKSVAMENLRRIEQQLESDKDYYNTLCGFAEIISTAGENFAGINLPINLIAIDYLDVFSSKLELKFDENSFHVREFMSSVRPYKKNSRTSRKFILRSLVSALKDKDIISQLLSKKTLDYENRSVLLDGHYDIDLELLGPSSLIVFLNKCKDSNPRENGIQILLGNGFTVQDIIDTLEEVNDKASSLAIFLDYCQKPSEEYPYENGIRKLLDNKFTIDNILEALRSTDINRSDILSLWRKMKKKLESEKKYTTGEEKTACESLAQRFEVANRFANDDSETASVSSSDSSRKESERGGP